MQLLKGLLSEETYALVEEQLKDKDIKLANLKEGNYVSIEKYNTAVSDLDTTRAELTERTSDLTRLKETTGNSEELKAQLEKIEEDFKQKELDYQAKLLNNEKQAILDKQVLKSGTIDEVSVKAHLDNFLKEAEFKDGNIIGLDEQLAKLKEDKSYLFTQAQATGLKHKDPVKPKTDEQLIAEAMGIK